MKTIVERADAICARSGISRYRLAQLLRLDQSTLRQKVEGSQPMDWLLRRCEEEGLAYFEMKERELGIFGKKE